MSIFNGFILASLLGAIVNSGELQYYDDIKEFRPDVAVLTNITGDHLDRFPKTVDYLTILKQRRAREK